MPTRRFELPRHPLQDGCCGQSAFPQAHLVNVTRVAQADAAARGANLQSSAPPAVANHRTAVRRRGVVCLVHPVEVDPHLTMYRRRASVHRHRDVRPLIHSHRSVAVRRRRTALIKVADGVRRLPRAIIGCNKDAPSVITQLRDELTLRRARRNGPDPSLKRELLGRRYFAICVVRHRGVRSL
jgi:hypothetical protein